MAELITSPSNPRVKALVRLKDRRERDRTGLFLVEGFRELSRAVEGGIEIETLYVAPALYLGGNEDALVGRAVGAGARVVELSEEAFRKASHRDRPEGLLAVARQFPTGLGRLDPPAGSLLLVVEAIEKPGNLGTMVRTADAAGCAAVVVCDPTTDPFNPNVVRASLGTLFVVPLAVATTPEAISWCADRGVATIASTPGTSLPYWEADLSGGVAIVVGTEQYGLSDAWLHRADIRVRIPMHGRADSLNAAMSAGILLYEAVRQRS